MTLSTIYRQTIRFGCRSLSTHQDEAVLLGAPINSLTMDDLEAFFWLVFGYDPRRLAPPGYRTARP
jgi:hypothetical protein